VNRLAVRVVLAGGWTFRFSRPVNFFQMSGESQFSCPHVFTKPKKGLFFSSPPPKNSSSLFFARAGPRATDRQQRTACARLAQVFVSTFVSAMRLLKVFETVAIPQGGACHARLICVCFAHVVSKTASKSFIFLSLILVLLFISLLVAALVAALDSPPVCIVCAAWCYLSAPSVLLNLLLLLLLLLLVQ
jgi:hypothetical protein